MNIVFLIIGLVLAGMAALVLVRSQRQQYEARLAEQKQQYEDRLQHEHQAHQEQVRLQQEQQQEQLARQQEQQKEQMAQQLSLIREQMNTASERILKQRSEELSANNRVQLSTILTPLQENIRQMKEQSERMQSEHTRSMERLDASIRSNLERERAMGEQTERLAQALTGENKVQGNFGELRLKQILQDMGLEEGTQFEEQLAMRDENNRVITEDDGHRMIPDVILHFPDHRDVIIDSKMSFTAFVDYQNAQSAEERQDALRRHLQSMRSHVRELAQKQYFRYTSKESAKLDFVLMYVFQESALQLALLNDPTLWKDAYEQGVIISGSQNLYMTLRVLELTWKQTRQLENQENMMKCANQLVERVQNFAERFAKVQDMLGRTQKAFAELDTVTAPSGQSITVAARNLLKFGAQENKKKKSLQQTGTIEEKEIDN